MKYSIEYLKESIIGETNASKMYEIFSKIAKQEGFKNVAYLFYTLKKAELIHIRNHEKALGDPNFTFSDEKIEAGTTIENLKTAFEGETFEYKKMYPKFLKAIKKETKEEFAKVAQLSMIWAKKVEKTHAKLLKNAIKFIKSGKDFDSKNLYLCTVCGNIVSSDSHPEDVCPICGHDHQFYNKSEFEKN